MNFDINKDELTTAIEFLRGVADGTGDIPYTDRGLCYNLHRIGCKGCRKYLSFIVNKWPEFSGSKSFPIKSYLGVSYHTEKDKYIGGYGDSRRRLAEWWADRLEEIK